MKKGLLIHAAAILLCAAALSGCLADKVHRPASAAGAICAEQCDQQRLQCNDAAESSALSARGSCQARRDHVEQRCSPWVKDADKQRCQLANNPDGPTCSDPSPDYGSCTATWRTCITSCGGWFE
ncbi:hypothetical protein [Pseudoxanthomonas sp. X-1]|uniref:hypothetical protein n=1 Tax=Pseudoxanthomonas sp. X-1 TaxID=2571115 RepID=UPI00110AA9B9|nr:hypothetical protein [Pseudoxanthomonas sp. X-1]TMN17896.1 hypothetical protein FF950_16015 [Pseudoxanthomonas sp. X-1]UAY76449.1 hypothetical protein LAJ50_09580 [Pseudoxanthomonas sp. X-1]